MSWKCHCGLINNGLNEQCAAAKSSLFSHIEHYQISENKPDLITVHLAVVDTSERRLAHWKGKIRMTPDEELFAQYYNSDRILVRDMDVVQLREHREKLAKIAFEAKAKLQATDDEIKERHQKSKKKEWLVTPEISQTTSDAINVVKVRKERMSKMDKMREQLLKTGMDEETVKEMIKNMERRATESDVKTITFKSNVTTEEIKVIQVQASPDEKKPFDVSKLGF